jgi:hypothetical protein
MDWIHLARDTDRWWALVNAVMNFRFLENCIIFELAENFIVYQE